MVYINHKVHPSNDSIWLKFLGVLFLLFASNATQTLSGADGGGGGGVVELQRC